MFRGVKKDPSSFDGMMGKFRQYCAESKMVPAKTYHSVYLVRNPQELYSLSDDSLQTIRNSR